MLAVGRALLLNASLYLMDEPSEGLAPTIVDDLIDVVHQLVGEGSRRARSSSRTCAPPRRWPNASWSWCRDASKHETTASELAENPELQRQYLGVDAMNGVDA